MLILEFRVDNDKKKYLFGKIVKFWNNDFYFICEFTALWNTEF
jgi:hypothetical protein